MKTIIPLAALAAVIFVIHACSSQESPGTVTTIDSEALYMNNCASCHADSGVSKAPTMTLLASMTPRGIYGALNSGKMRMHGEQLSEAEKRALADYLSDHDTYFNPNEDSLGAMSEDLNPCSVFVELSAQPSWNGWGGDVKNSGFKKGTGLNAQNVSKLKLKWAYGFPDAVRVRSQPAIVGDMLIIGSQNGSVYAINAKTGCTLWHTEVNSAVRGAITVAPGPRGKLTAFLADFSTSVFALDIEDGSIIWETKVGKHVQNAVTGSVTLHGNTLFIPLTSMEVLAAMNPDYDCCTSSGGVVAINALNGEELWHFNTIQKPPKVVGEKENGGKIYAPSGAIVWSSPTVDAGRNLLYIGTGENYTRPTTAYSDAILALDMTTGELQWAFQGTADDGWNLDCFDEDNRINCPDPPGPDLDFGMAPILTTREDGKEVLIVGQKSGVVRAMDPDDNGKLLWETRVGKGTANGGIHWGMASDGKLAYAPVNDNPYWPPDPESEYPLSPGVYALDVTTGKVVWEQPAPEDICKGKSGCMESNSQAPSLIEDVLLAGSLDGHIRAYAANDGAVLWEFNTMKKFKTINGVRAKGGSLDGAGPVAQDGMLYVNSGYGLHGEAPGNVLLAFEIAE